MDPLNKIINDIKSKVEKTYVNTDYSESYVVFLDIMGMRELVKSNYQELRKIFNVVEQAQIFYGNMSLPSGEKFISVNQVNITVMSDSIVLSIDSNVDYAFSKVIGFSSYLIQNFIDVLSFPVFLRGAVTKGLIFQDEKVVFGPALVDAYTLESKTASSMRCIISTTLDSDLQFKKYLNTSEHALLKDQEDGLYFIKFANKKNEMLLLDYAGKIIISCDAQKIKDKYNWLVNYIKNNQL